MLDERKTQILRTVVEEYIQTAQPVGSGHVASAADVNVSSATVRNEMAALEADGFLLQPHTSAGRIPTEKGYRYYVDALSDPALDRTSARQVRTFFDHAHAGIEAMLADTTRLLTGLTNYAAMVVGPSHDVVDVRSVQLVSLAPRLVLFVAVLANGSVEKRTVELPEDTDADLVDRAGVHLAGHLVDRTLAAGLDAVAPSGDVEIDAAVRAVVDAVDTRTAPENVFVHGSAQMAAAFEAVETVRSVLTILEQQFVVVTLLRDVVDRGLSVAIGSETGMQPLSDCALVVAPYTVDGDTVGTVGVLGPTRMNYPQALAAVAVVGQQLGHRLSEG